MVVACYAAAGFTFGTVTAGAGVPAAVIGCNAALGTRDGPRQKTVSVEKLGFKVQDIIENK